MSSAVARRAGAGVLVLALVAGLSACEDEGTATERTEPTTSALSGGARTCTDAGAACATSGSLRWSLPLTGTYRVDDPGLGSLRSLSSATLSEEGTDIALAADGDTVYVGAGTRVLAVDAATGRVRWSHRYPRAVPSTAFVSGDRLLVEQEVLGEGERFMSLNTRTGADLAIPLRAGEDLLDRWGRPGSLRLVPVRGLTLLRGELFDESASSGVRSVDPVTGRTRWRVPLRPHRSSDVRGGVLYLDDYGPKKSEDSYQTWAIQRVDLVTGRRLPDVRLPTSLRGERHLSYVTRDKTIVLTGDDVEYAVDVHGREVTPVPPDDDTDDTEGEGKPPLRVEGPDNGVQRLAGYGDSGTKRWTGPAMRAPGTWQLARTTPKLAVAAACAPDAVRAGTLEDPFPAVFCDKPRLFAVTW